MEHIEVDIERIKQSIQGDTCGEISYFETIDSTNQYLLDNGKCGDICISEMQTKGRGRRGNQWLSTKSGNIYFSQCWCFNRTNTNGNQYWSLLGLITGVAIAEALADIGLENHGVKWPNDIYWQEKKLGGILLEAPNQSGKVVIGIGLNINMQGVKKSEISQPFISLLDALEGRRFSRDNLITALIKRLTERLKGFDEFDVTSFKQFKKAWKQWDVLQGRRVSFKHQGEILEGAVVDINEVGCIGIRTQDQISFFSAIDIRLQKESV